MLLYVYWAVLLNPMNWYPETRSTRMPVSPALRPDRSQLPGDGSTHSIDITTTSLMSDLSRAARRATPAQWWTG